MNMELDDMKQLWQKMDATMQKQQAMNEQRIKNMLHERRVSTVQVMINTEAAGMVFCIVLLGVMLTQIARIGSHAGVIACYVFSLLGVAFSIVFCVYKIKHLKSLDAGKENVSDMTEKTERFRLLIAKERLASLVLGPLLIACFLVVVLYLLIGINVLDNPQMYMFHFIAATAFYYIFVVLAYRKFYFTPLKSISSNLQEIAEFKAP